jgi:hypothetical protein
MRIFPALAAVVTVLALTSCDRPAGTDEAPAAAPSFSHAASGDVSGYYLPMDEVRVGKWSFDHLFIGQVAEFEAWEQGTRGATFAPVMLQFDDSTSPMAQTELGETRSVTVRILPTAYAVNDARIRFEGRSPQLGRVIFDGRLDQGALATSRRNLGDEGVVLTGSLKVGDARPQAMRLRWWMGD